MSMIIYIKNNQPIFSLNSLFICLFLSLTISPNDWVNSTVDDILTIFSTYACGYPPYFFVQPHWNYIPYTKFNPNYCTKNIQKYYF
jgi:hypothetical protein